MNAGTRGFEGSTYVDAAVFYNITDKSRPRWTRSI